MKTSRQRWLHWLPLLLPFLPAILAFPLLGSDTPAFFLWWLTLTIFGFAVLPLAGRLFRVSPDRGFLFAKPLGLVLVAVVVFILASLKLAPFRQLTILSILVLLAAAVHLSPLNRSFWRSATQPKTLLYWGIEETLFGLTSLVWTFARGLHPALDSLEKFMDYGFMMSLWRTDYLPAADMWLAAKPINYYYFGQYITTLWAKACSIPPETAYNLAMASLFALTFCLTFAIALLLGTMFRRAKPGTSTYLPPVFAGTAAVLLTLGGNGHVFYYGSSRFGSWLHGVFSRWGWPVGERSAFYWFADATRYIGYNPDTVDKTIHEFPFYSFLVADLHAHVANLPLVLLALGLLAVIISRPLGPAPSLIKLRQPVANMTKPQSLSAKLKIILPEPHSLLLAGLLAVFMMGNYWDFVIYFAVSAVVFVLREQKQPATIANGRAILIASTGVVLLAIPFLFVTNIFLAVAAYSLVALLARFAERHWSHALTVAIARLAEVFFLAHLIALPFNYGFEPIAKTIAGTVNQTPLIQLWVLYGFFLIAALAFMFDLSHERRQEEIRSVQTLDTAAMPVAKGDDNRFLTPLLNLATTDRLLLVFVICGFGLILLPELVYVVDIYSGDYKRANTMFKFTYQAFVLLSFVLAWAPLRLLFLPAASEKAGRLKSRNLNQASANNRRRLLGFLLLFLWAPSLMYPFTAASQWLGPFKPELYQGLDGVYPFSEKDSIEIPGANTGELAPDYEAILWFNQEVSGQPVVLESYGDQYTDYCRISAYTGLPTVIGWQTHEWLWRTSKATPDAYSSVVVPRQQDVRTIYTSEDQTEVRQLLDHYEVRYIVIGDLERQKFMATDDAGQPESLVNETLLRSLGEVAFESGSLYVIALP
ncbi:MAG: DUF2298 domain-containing protein [Saccharofermentanales bacterium]